MVFDDHSSKQDKNITIEDVAQAAGVAISTVSRALNGRPDVSEKTRERVLKIVDELGYEPHTRARSLAAGHTRTIALLFPMEHSTDTQLELDFFVSAAQIATEKRFYFNLNVKPLTEEGLLNLYRSAQVDGVILMQIHLHDWRVRLLHERGLPFVMIGRCNDNTGLNFVDFQFEKAVKQAVDFLHRKGNQHIGFLTRPAVAREAKLGSAWRSMQGYQEATALYGLTPHYREAAFTPAETQTAVESLLAENPRLTALVTVNGTATNIVIRTLAAHGRRVPEDFEVVTIATQRIAELVTPMLTSIDFPSEEMGRLATDMLLARIMEPETPVEHVLLAPQLIERDSTRKGGKRGTAI